MLYTCFVSFLFCLCSDTFASFLIIFPLRSYVYDCLFVPVIVCSSLGFFLFKLFYFMFVYVRCLYFLCVSDVFSSLFFVCDFRSLLSFLCFSYISCLVSLDYVLYEFRVFSLFPLRLLCLIFSYLLCSFLVCIAISFRVFCVFLFVMFVYVRFVSGCLSSFMFLYCRVFTVLDFAFRFMLFALFCFCYLRLLVVYLLVSSLLLCSCLCLYVIVIVLYVCVVSDIFCSFLIFVSFSFVYSFLLYLSLCFLVFFCLFMLLSVICF